MQAASKFKDLKWQFVGPTNISGRVTDVAVVAPKGKTHTVYAASASGGVWKTENEGTTWTPGLREHGRRRPSATSPWRPRDPEHRLDRDRRAQHLPSLPAGIGVFKSTDGGQDLDASRSGEYEHDRPHRRPSPNPRVVYVAATGHEWTLNPERGVYKTVDGGKNWEKVPNVNEETGANDLVMDPKDNDTLYAATWQRTRKKWNDPRNDAGPSGQRRLEDDGRGQDLDADQRRASRRRNSAAGSASICA